VINFENDMTSYHTKMYKLFKIENPNVAVTKQYVAVTKQYVADQHRTIVFGGLLANAIIEEIKMQVREEHRIN
jgi:hypothetical protein